MRILMASDLFHPFLLGGEKRMYEVARRLAKKHDIHVLTRRFKGLPSYEVHEGVHIHRVFVPSAGVKLESPTDGSAFMAALYSRAKLGTGTEWSTKTSENRNLFKPALRLGFRWPRENTLHHRDLPGPQAWAER